MTRYRYRNPQGEWVAELRRDEAIQQCAAMVRSARRFGSAFVWTDEDPSQIVAFVTSTVASDEELRQKLDLPFVEIVRVSARSGE